MKVSGITRSGTLFLWENEAGKVGCVRLPAVRGASHKVFPQSFLHGARPMRLKSARYFLVVASVGVLLLFPNMGLGCGPFFEPVLFSPQDSPDTGPAFAAGNLGILHQGMRVPFLALAYRYL